MDKNKETVFNFIAWFEENCYTKNTGTYIRLGEKEKGIRETKIVGKDNLWDQYLKETNNQNNMKKSIEMSLETARELSKVCAENKGVPFGSLSKFLLENFTLQELESNSEVEEMYKLWEQFSGYNKHSLPWDKKQCECDTDKANDVAFSMLKAIVKEANRDWSIDWNNNDQRKYYVWFNILSIPDFAYRVRDHCSISYSVSSRLFFKSEEICKDSVNKYLPIWKVYIKV